MCVCVCVFVVVLVYVGVRLLRLIGTTLCRGWFDKGPHCGRVWRCQPSRGPPTAEAAPPAAAEVLILAGSPSGVSGGGPRRRRRGPPMYDKTVLVRGPPIVLVRSPECAAPFYPIVGANVAVTADPWRVTYVRGGVGRGAWAAVKDAVMPRGVTTMRVRLERGDGMSYLGVARVDTLDPATHPLLQEGGYGAAPRAGGLRMLTARRYSWGICLRDGWLRVNGQSVAKSPKVRASPADATAPSETQRFPGIPACCNGRRARTQVRRKLWSALAFSALIAALVPATARWPQ